MLSTLNLKISYIKALLLIVNIAIIFSKKKKTVKAKAPKAKVPSNYTNRIQNLSDESFGQFNKTNNLFFLYFTRNDCKKCNRFYPHYLELSDKLFNSEYKIPCVLVNTDQSPNLKSHYNITKPGKLYFANYKENEFYKYEGVNQPKYIIEYANHHLNYTNEEITKWEDLNKKKIYGNNLVFVGDPKKFEGIYKRVCKAAKNDDITNIFWTHSAEIHEKFGIDKNSFDVVMVGKKDKKINVKAILKVEESNTVAQINFLIEVNDRKLWGKADDMAVLLALEVNPPTPTVFVIYSKKNKEQAEYNKEINTVFDNLSKNYVKDFHFMNFTINTNYATPFIDIFNLTKKNTPYVVLVDHNPKFDDDVDKYLFPLDQKINEENVQKFLSDFRAKKLKKIIFSEHIDSEGTLEQDGVHKLVGANYENFLFKETVGKDVFLYFYSDFNPSTYDLIHERVNNTLHKLKENSHLLFARVQPLLNELQVFAPIEKMPAVFFIRGDDEDSRRKNIIKYSEELYNTTNFVNFIKKHSSKSVTEKTLQNELELLEEELEDTIEALTKDHDEENINYDQYNAGLRRHTKYLIDEAADEEDPDLKKYTKKPKKEKKKSRKEDL